MPSPRDTAVFEVVDSALETSRERAKNLGVTIASAVDRDARVLADPEKLRGVIINLVENALDALEESPPTEPRVELASGAKLLTKKHVRDSYR